MNLFTNLSPMSPTTSLSKRPPTKCKDHSPRDRPRSETRCMCRHGWLNMGQEILSSRNCTSYCTWPVSRAGPSCPRPAVTHRQCATYRHQHV